MMEQDAIPSPQDLPNKPLIEAIFEVKWDLQEDTDPGYQILLGRFYDRVKDRFPVPENLPVAMMPDNMLPHVVRHRFRKAKDGWPLVQIGPGILAANDTSGYTWASFRPVLKYAVEALFAAYPSEIAQLSIQEANLRYINVVPLPSGDNKVLDFIKENLHTGLLLDSQLFDDPSASQEPTGLQIRLNYPLAKPKGLGVLTFTTGLRENVPSIIWENHVTSRGSDAPSILGAFDSWFDEAHSMIERWFFTLSRGNLLEAFGGKR